MQVYVWGREEMERIEEPLPPLLLLLFPAPTPCLGLALHVQEEAGGRQVGMG